MCVSTFVANSAQRRRKSLEFASSKFYKATQNCIMGVERSCHGQRRAPRTCRFGYGLEPTTNTACDIDVVMDIQKGNDVSHQSICHLHFDSTEPHFWTFNTLDKRI